MISSRRMSPTPLSSSTGHQPPPSVPNTRTQQACLVAAATLGGCCLGRDQTGIVMCCIQRPGGSQRGAFEMEVEGISLGMARERLEACAGDFEHEEIITPAVNPSAEGRAGGCPRTVWGVA